MSNASIIKDLKRERERIVAEIDQKQGVLKALDVLIQHYEQHDRLPAQMIDRAPAKRISRGKLMDDEMEHIYEEAKTPLHPREMYERLRAKGIQVPGQDPIRNVAAHQSLDKERFASFGSGKWGLTKWIREKQSNTEREDQPDGEQLFREALNSNPLPYP